MSELITLSDRRGKGVEISKPSGFEPIGIVTARIVGKLMARLQKDAA